MDVVDNRREGFADKIKANPTVKKLKKIKNLQLIAAVFIIAVALLIYSGVASKSKSTDVEQVSQSVMDEEEQRLSKILGGIEGAGTVETMITRKDGEIVGILVIAEGAEDISVMLKLLSATTTVMGVDKSIVDVYAMK